VFSKRTIESEVVDFESFISIKGIKALGNQFSVEKIKKVITLENLPFEEPVEVPVEDPNLESESQASLFDKN
jgi:topoisomerase-4 subunit A